MKKAKNNYVALILSIVSLLLILSNYFFLSLSISIVSLILGVTSCTIVSRHFFLYSFNYLKQNKKVVIPTFCFAFLSIF